MTIIARATYQVKAVARAAEEMGLTVISYDRSGLSEAEYLEIGGDDIETGPVKIRFASHGTRPTYGRLNGYADFEVAKGQGHADANGGAYDAIRWLANLFGLTAPSWAAPEAEAKRRERARAAAATRATNNETREADIVAALFDRVKDAPGALPPGAAIAKEFDITMAAAKRVRSDLQWRRNTYRRG